MSSENREIEVRFLEINEEEFKKRLLEAGAEDLQEDLLEEVIFYDQNLSWKKIGKFIRLRKTRQGTLLTYKHNKEQSIDGTEEIEITVDSLDNAETFLERLGFVAFRHQQKKRHSFSLDNVTIDIDTWPKIPTYVELEGESEDELRKVAAKLGFKWEEATFDSARTIIEKRYSVPVGDMKWFTFDKFE